MKTASPQFDFGQQLVIEAKLAEIAPSPTNPRKDFAPAALEELAMSIKAHGVIQPLLCRTPLLSSAGSKKYELVAGERRWRAAKLLGLATVPIIVRDLSDAEVVEMQWVENLQRADLSPLEEADGYQRLIQSGKYTADTLAEKLGKSRSYIFGRLKLTRLYKPIREALAAGKITHSHAERIALIPEPGQQEKCLKDLMEDTNWNDEIMSVSELEDLIANGYRRCLKAAVFDRKAADYSWPDKAYAGGTRRPGACAECPKCSANMREMFPEIKKPDICTDPECFAKKEEQHRARAITDLRLKANGGIVWSEKEARTIFERGALSWQATDTYFDLKEAVPGGKRPWREALGKHLPADKIIHALDDLGRPHQLISHATARAAVQAAGLKIPLPDKARETNDEAKKQKQDKEKANAMAALAVPELVRAAEKSHSSDVLRAVVRWLDAGFICDGASIFARRGWEDTGKLTKHSDELSEAELRGLVVELLFADAPVNARGLDDEFLAGCKQFGVDLKKIEQTQKAAAAEARKAGKPSPSAGAPDRDAVQWLAGCPSGDVNFKNALDTASGATIDAALRLLDPTKDKTKRQILERRLRVLKAAVQASHPGHRPTAARAASARTCKFLRAGENQS